MNAREGLFLAAGFSAALLVALIALATRGSADRDLQDRLIALQRETKADSLKLLQGQLDESKQKIAELEQARQAEAQARMAMEMKVRDAETRRKVEAEGAAMLRLAEASRRATAAAERAAQESSAMSGDQLFEQGAALEQQGLGAEAVRAYVRAARTGNSKASKRLGEIYDKGIPGVSRDYAESLKWYNTARALGEDLKDVRRQSEQAIPAPAGAETLRVRALSLEQEGKSKEAVEVYRRAARAGDGKAANRLGEIYGKGIPGVDLNYAESLKWCNTARALGEEPNCARR